MNSLDIGTSRVAIDIHSQYARLEISNNLSRRMKVKVVRPQMVVERKAASFKVERSGRAALSLNHSGQLKRLVLNKNVQKSNQLAPEKAKNTSLPYETAYNMQLRQPEFTVELESSQAQNPVQTVQLPQEGSKQIVWDPGYVKVDWEAGGIQIEWDEHVRPEIQVSPHSVEIRVKGRNMVHIGVVEDKVPGQKGRKINKRV